MSDTPDGFARRTIAEAREAFEDHDGGSLLKACAGCDVPGTASAVGSHPDGHWIELALVDERDMPAVGVGWKVVASDGETFEGVLDDTGIAYVSNIAPGSARISFPELDRRLWGPA